MHFLAIICVSSCLLATTLPCVSSFALGLTACSEADFLLDRTCPANVCLSGRYPVQFCQCNDCPASAGTEAFDRKFYYCLVRVFKVCPEVVAKGTPALVALREGRPNRTIHAISARNESMIQGEISSDTSDSKTNSDVSSAIPTTIASSPAVYGSRPTKTSFNEPESKGDSLLAAKLSAGLTAGILAVLGITIGLAVWCSARSRKEKSPGALRLDTENLLPDPGQSCQQSPSVSSNAQYPADTVVS